MLKQKDRSICGSSFFFLLTLCLLLLFATSAPAAWAADESGKTVRVGYYQGDDKFQAGFSEEERKSGYAYDYYQEIAPLVGWNYEYIYGTRTEITDKLISGDVDIVAGIYKTDKRKNQMLFSKLDMGLEGDERYFAVNCDRKDLLRDLNEAMGDIRSSNPKFTTALYEEYYVQNTPLQLLSDYEKDYLGKMDSLKVGYVKDNMPLSDEKAGGNGKPTGAVEVLLSHISDYLKIPIDPRGYDTADDMEKALRSGEIDAGFPVYYDLWVAECKDLFQTEAIISDRIMIIYQGDYSDDLMDKVALSETGLGQSDYLAEHYPGSEKMVCADRSDALQAVEDGKANCTIGCASILQYFLAGHEEYQDYHVAYLDASENFSMAVSRDNYVLAKILNKAVLQLDDAVITNAVVRYSNVETEYTFLDFLRKYAIVVIAILTVFFAVLLWTFIRYRHKTNQFNAAQKKTNAALADALNAANAANNAKTSFLSNMSHDIRTPMNGIVGMTAIAAAHIDDKARVEDCLTKITSSSKHLLGLINEVLDMSKIESGKIDLNEEPCNLCELMDDLLTLNKPQANAKNQDITVHVLDVFHEDVIGDGLRLQQVFTNLVSNAIKYTPNGGKIEITLLEKPSSSSKLAWYEFIVEDNGIGMSESYLPHVFDAFTRADESTANETQGTGLGMPIARNIARMMDGDIAVESTLGKGSKFTASLFLKLPEEEIVSHADFINLHVLVVDDDQIACESTSLLLNDLGMKSEWVLSGREALARIEERHQEDDDYFAVLLDWKMPEMDGLETTREIRKRFGRDIPIIIISAYDWHSIEQEALEAGADGFVGKPLFKSRLSQLFNGLMGHEAAKLEAGLNEITAQSDFSGKRVLLTEDNELNAEIAMEILSMIGMTVEWARDGQEAVDMMKNSVPGYYACIFMDVQMPVMNGIDATKAIRNLPNADAKTIPIFAMTANVFADDVMTAMNAGMNEHIAKPLNLDALMQVLNKYLE